MKAYLGEGVLDAMTDILEIMKSLFNVSGIESINDTTLSFRKSWSGFNAFKSKA
jgi:hypothetical protein